MNAASAATTAVHWDLSNIFSSLSGDDYREGFALLSGDISELAKWLDENGIARAADKNAASPTVLKELLRRTSDVAMRLETLEAYVEGHVTTNSYDNAAAREMSKVDALTAQWKKLVARIQGWIGTMAEECRAWVDERESIRPFRFFIDETARQSQYLMSDESEALAAELCLDGAVAFGKLQGNAASQIKVEHEIDGKIETISITALQNLRYHADESVRRKAHEAEVAAWHSIRTTVAACLNAVKGTASTLARRRGRPSVLAEALDQNRIDQPTLSAMMDSIRDAQPTFRRYLKAKAKKLGKEQLAWWDIFAPLGSSQTTFDWDGTRAFLLDKFGGFDDDMARMTTTAFEQGWIDAEPRDGKRVGAFCMGIPRTGESRILCNFDGSFEQVCTLAHELGHAYHNHCQRELDPLLRGAPMTLAETASIFCETLVAEATLPVAPPSEQLMILESQLAGATQVCLDIRSRFLFESAVVESRAESELSADELCELMRKAQSETYGDSVDPATYHPYMWLWKPHYYRHTANFYNFPYAFGHLFGLGLYSIYREEGASFVPNYKALLRETNQDLAAPLAARFGIDIRSPEFWRKSLATIAEQVERFEAIEA